MNLGGALIAAGVALGSYSLAQLPGTFQPPGMYVSALACTPNTGGGGNDGNVIGLWHFDNDGIDKSQGGHNLTLNSGSTYSNAQSKFGGYSYKGASGSSSASIAAGSAGIYSGIGDLTIEFWIYPTATMSTSNWFISDGTTGSVTTTFGVEFGYGGAGTTSIDNPGTTRAAFSPSTGTMTPALNAWHHWAWQRAGTTYTFYLDGTAQTTTSNSKANAGNGTAAWLLGNYGVGGANAFFNGYLDEFRFSNIARYSGNFTPATLAFCDTAIIPPPPGHAWNPADKTATVVLSNNNYDVQNSSTPVAGVRATTGVSSGKFYWELKAITAPAYTSMGISSPTATLGTNYLGSVTGTAGFRGDGGVAFAAASFGNVVNGFTTSAAINDVFGFALDMTTKKMWVAKNNTWLGAGGNPAGGSGENLNTIPAVAVFPVINPYYPSTTDTWRLQDGVGQALTYTPPTGFTAYGSM